MEIGISEAAGATVVELTGELDSGAADELRQALSALLDQGRARLVVDLEGVPYVESRGLGALVTAMKRARALGGDLKLCALRPEVLSIFGVTHLNKVVPVFLTRQEALASW
jgi:anti-sigma B factor antagonist